MRTSIQSQSFSVTPAIREWIEKHIQRNLQRYEADVVGVEVYISDLNGPRGGDDIRVVMRASLAGFSPVSVSTEHRDLYVGASRTAKRMRRAVRKTLKKARRIRPTKVVAMRRQALEIAT